MQQTIDRFTAKNELLTYDPYDIWKTPLGLLAKRVFNSNKSFGLIPAGALTLFDNFLNNRLRLFYAPQEYPIVRALAALSLLNVFQKSHEQRHLSFARTHLEWLASHPSSGYNGYGWGLGFTHAVSSEIIYDSNTPFSTITPYPLEAFIQYAQVSGDTQFDDVIRGVYVFLEKDLVVMKETENYLVTSYGPIHDRIVTNAVSYSMYSYALLLPYVHPREREDVIHKIKRLYAYIQYHQRPDGSWLYSPEGNSFIDCFHSCIIIKNLLKTNSLIGLDSCNDVISAGYDYLIKNHLNTREFLFKRFSKRNKPSIIKFDLYDNAEMLNLSILIRDDQLVKKLSHSINQHFCRGTDIDSQIDIFNVRRNRNMLRWAVMPYLYASSLMLIGEQI